MSYTVIAVVRDGTESMMSFLTGRTPVAYPFGVGTYDTVGEAVMALKRFLKGAVNTATYDVTVLGEVVEMTIVQPLTDGHPAVDLAFIITPELPLELFLEQEDDSDE